MFFKDTFKLNIVKFSIVVFMEQSSEAFVEHHHSFFDKLTDSWRD